MKFQYIRKLMSYLAPHKLTIIILLLGSLAGQACALFLPGLMSNIVDIGIKQNGLADSSALATLSEAEILNNQTAYILRMGLIMLALTAAYMLITVFVNYFMSKTSAGISAKIREDVFKKVMSFSNKEFDDISAASMINRTTMDVESVKQVILMTPQVIMPPIMMVGGIIMALQKSPSMSWLIGVGSIIVALFVFLVFRLITPKFKLLQKLLDKFNLIIKEQFSGAAVIRAFGANTFELERFTEANSELSNTNLFITKIITLMQPIMTISMNFISILIIWFGAEQISNSTIQIGDMMAFMQYATMVITAFAMLSFMIAMIPRALISIERVFEILDKENSLKDPENPKSLGSDFKGKIEFKNVSFKYLNAKEYVIKDINFTAKPKETIGILGSTGCGKTTLISLIPRFYDATQGEVLIDGINVKDITKSELRTKIGYVPQTGTLFSGDIASNLRYGDENASDEVLMEVAEIAQIADFVKENEKGLHAPISQTGSNVSGGQKQRFSIARTLVKNTKIYIFDDSFSKLDFKTDLALRKALLKHAADSTVLIVSQRIGTIMNADKILVMDEGRIIGQGTHEELLKTCEVYKEIANLQIAQEVLV